MQVELLNKERTVGGSVGGGQNDLFDPNYGVRPRKNGEDFLPSDGIIVRVLVRSMQE